MSELEESRRRLVNLKMQKDAASGVHSLVSGAANGSLSPEKHADKSMGLRELKDSIEETKVCILIQLSRFPTHTRIRIHLLLLLPFIPVLCRYWQLIVLLSYKMHVRTM